MALLVHGEAKSTPIIAESEFAADVGLALALLAGAEVEALVSDSQGGG